MKKQLILVGLFILYVVLVWIQLGIAVLINLSITGRPVGGITALGVVSFWTTYKIVKHLYSKIE